MHTKYSIKKKKKQVNTQQNIEHDMPKVHVSRQKLNSRFKLVFKSLNSLDLI